MRVLQVVTDTDRRGAQVFAHLLAPHLAGLGHPTTTVALAAGAGGGLDLPVLGPSRFHPGTLRALRAEARRHDVVLAHGSSTLPASVAATAGTGRPVVYRQVSDPTAWAGSGLRRLRVRSYYRFVDGVLALSDATAATLTAAYGVRPERITVVPNAVDAAAWPAGDDGTAARARLVLPDHPHPVIAAVGALAPEKRLDLLVDAVARLDGAPTLVLAGDGPARADLAARAASVGVDLRLLGWLADPADAYLAADVVALTSTTEAQPAVLLEAGACERPVVATAVGGVPAMVEDGTTGRLVPSGDVAALATALGGLLADPAARRAAGVAARARVLATADLAALAPLVAAALTARR